MQIRSYTERSAWKVIGSLSVSVCNMPESMSPPFALKCSWVRLLIGNNIVHSLTHKLTQRYSKLELASETWHWSVSCDNIKILKCSFWSIPLSLASPLSVSSFSHLLSAIICLWPSSTLQLQTTCNTIAFGSQSRQGQSMPHKHLHCSNPEFFISRCML